jgi:hypothetical protein
VVAEGQFLCEHQQLILRSHHVPTRTIYDWLHYLAVIQRKPGALRNGAPFAGLPEGFSQLQALMLRRVGGDREIVDILALVLPPNITLMPLPPKAPELNPVENLRQFIRDNGLSNRIFQSYDEIPDLTPVAHPAATGIAG